jgi:hypothetical protein
MCDRNKGKEYNPSHRPFKNLIYATLCVALVIVLIFTLFLNIVQTKYLSGFWLKSFHVFQGHGLENSVILSRYIRLLPDNEKPPFLS